MATGFFEARVRITGLRDPCAPLGMLVRLVAGRVCDVYAGGAAQAECLEQGLADRHVVGSLAVRETRVGECLLTGMRGLVQPTG